MIPLLRLLQMQGGREEGLEQNARRPTRSEAGVWGRCAQMPSLPSWEAARPLASPQGSGSVFRALGTAAGWEGPTLCFLPTAGTSGIPRPQRAKLVLCLLEPWVSSCQEGSPLRQARALGRLLGPDPSCSGLATGPGTRTAFLPSDLLPSPRAGKFSSHGA